MKFAKVPVEKTVKTLVYEGNDGLVAFLVRGDHQLNEIKVSKLPQVTNPLRQASADSVRQAFGAGFGSLGPVLSGTAAAGAPKVTFIADHAVAAMTDFGVGANEDQPALRRRELGPRPARARASSATCATSSKATRARAARARSRSCAASRWDTSSSSARSIRRP